MSSLSTKPANPDLFCSDLSLEAGESMAGTASTVDAWFLLEYSGVWRAKATDDNDLPRQIQDWLNEQLALVGNGRVQFIKQSRLAGTVGITLFVALTREVSPLLYQFQLDAYEDLLQLDITAILAGGSSYDEFLRAEPLYLICTNGKRDRCCARVGSNLFQALVGQVGDATWQCTHLGGHRFAPTLVTFPDGAFYGRLTPADLESFVAAQHRGKLYLENLRGRCCYDPMTQAAEQFLRLETGVRERNGYRLLGRRRLDEVHWAVAFASALASADADTNGEVHRLIVAREMSAGEQLVSCSPPKAKPVARFSLVSYEIADLAD